VVQNDAIVQPHASIATNGGGQIGNITASGNRQSDVSAIPPDNIGRRRAVPLVIAAGLLLVAGISWVMLRPQPTLQTAPAAKTLAVLRFRNVDGQPADEFLAEAIANGLLTNLSRAPHLKVVDRERSFAHSLDSETTQQIGRSLAV